MTAINPKEPFGLRMHTNKVKIDVLIILVFALLGTTHINAQSPDAFPSFEKMQQEAREFNKTVADEEMVKFFELIFKYHPKNLADFQSHSPEERKAFLAMHRDMANEAGVEISTLRGLSEDELRQIDEIAKWDAEAAILAEDALSRLQNYSTEEYRTIVDEAVQMISKFDPSSADHLKRQTFTDDFPKGLAFIKPDMIHVGEDWCVIFLQKGIGRGIGYNIAQSDSGEWTIAWFNEYADWGRTPIDLEHPEPESTN